MKKIRCKKLFTIFTAAVLVLTASFSCLAAEDDDAPDLMDGEVAYAPEPAYEPEPVYEAPEESYSEPEPAAAEPMTVTPGAVKSPVEYTESEDETYEDGGYVSGSYSRACPDTWSNTGDQRYDMIQTALTQVGYRDVSNHTKYNVWFFGYDCGESWCATFLSWCAYMADIPSYVLEATAVASPDRFGLGYRSIYYDDVQAGDLAFIENDASNGYAGFDHVGLVYYVDDNYIYTVEGNCADCVQCCVYGRSSGKTTRDDTDRIVWLATPDYEGGSETDEMPQTLPATLDVHLSCNVARDGREVPFIEASFNGNEVLYCCSLEAPLCRTTSYLLDVSIRK